MKRFHGFLFLSFSFCYLLFNTSFAQQVSPPAEKTAVEKSGFKLFFEKVYLHFDRQLYATGEDIWFKAYLLNAQNNGLIGTSNNLYVELISPDFKLIDRKVIRVDDGIGVGDFQLKDSIPEGKYHIRAYTNWMRNFRNCFIFEKDIDIHSMSGVKPKIKLLNPDTTKYDVTFFPEGGSLVSGVASVVGFKALDILGNGCNVSGNVISSDGDTIGMFASSHQGMGKFSFLPIGNKKYYAWVTSNNRILKFDLPAIQPKGFVMRINNTDTANIVVTVSTNLETFNEFKDKEMLLIGQSKGKSYYNAKIKIINQQFSIKMSKFYFPNGITSITLMDNSSKPYCERLVYIERKANYTVSVVPNKKNYKGREEVVLEIKTLDAQKNPVKANLSLSVVDANQIPAGTGSIVSYALLESEIKGKIEKPIQYFDTANVNRFKQMDLLLLTQGWRDFVWKQLQDSGVHIKYMVEPGITISGRVRQKFFNKPISGANVTMFLAGAKKFTMFTTADTMGKYFIDGVEFYGRKHLVLTSSDKKGKKTGWILRDSFLFARPIVIPFKQEYNVVKPEIKLFANEADFRKNAMKKFTLSDTISLSDVVISSISKKKEEQNRIVYLNGSTPDYDFTIGPDDYTFTDIGGFLMFKVPGTQPAALNEDNANDAPNIIAFRSMGALTKPRFVLDNLSLPTSDEYVVYNLSMEQIDRIVISRTDPMASDIASRNRYVVVVFTKPGALDKKDFYTISEYVDGYYQPRVFYSPKYTNPRKEGEKPDLRTTIYWNHNVITNENGQATVTFSNADKPTSIKATIEGMSDKGIPMAGFTQYEVK